MPEASTQAAEHRPDPHSELRRLAHDLSNAIETILQASYLLGQAKLPGDLRKWTHMVEKAAEDAARLNREIRDVLRNMQQA
jgi:hypothetical protein